MSKFASISVDFIFMKLLSFGSVFILLTVNSINSFDVFAENSEFT